MSQRTFRHTVRERLLAHRGQSGRGRVTEQALELTHAGFVDWTGEEAELAAHTMAQDLKGLGLGAFVRNERTVVMDGTVNRKMLTAMIRRYTFVAQAEIR